MSFWYDLAMLAIWPIVARYNRQAFLMYFLLVYYTFLFYSLDTNFQIFSFAALAFFMASVTKINILSKFRICLFVHGVVYYVSAVDEVIYYHFNINTWLIHIRFWLICFIDLIIIITLTGGEDGTKRIIRLDRYLDNCRVYGLLLRKAAHTAIQRGKKA